MARPPIDTSNNTSRRPVKKIEIAWDGVTYVDESARVISIAGVSEITAPDAGLSAVGASIADACTVILNNTDRRYGANNPSAALYSLLNRTANPANAGGYLRPIRISLGFVNSSGTPQYLQVFQGVIVKPAERWGERTYELECLDRWVLLRRKRASTGLLLNRRPDELIQEALNASALGYASSLEPSERIIEYAWLDDDPIADELVRIVTADGGLIWFRWDGTLMYASSSWPARNTTSVYTFTTQRFEALEPEWDFDQVYDQISVRCQPLYPGLLETIWESGEEIVIEPGGTRAITAQWRQPAYAVVDPLAYSTDEDATDWIARTSANQPMESGGASLVTVALSNVKAQRCTVMLTNTDTSRRAYIGRLRIRGQLLVPGQEIHAAAGSGDQVLSIDNEYVQNRAHAQAIADALRQRFRRPRQTVRLSGVPAQPHLEVTDRVTVTETSTGINRDFFIARKAYRFSADDGYVEDYDLVDVADFTEHSNYFRMGTSVYGGPGVSGAGRVWY